MWELAIIIWTGGKMEYDDHVRRGRDFRIAVGVTVLIILIINTAKLTVADNGSAGHSSIQGW